MPQLANMKWIRRAVEPTLTKQSKRLMKLSAQIRDLADEETGELMIDPAVALLLWWSLQVASTQLAERAIKLGDPGLQLTFDFAEPEASINGLPRVLALPVRELRQWIERVRHGDASADLFTALMNANSFEEFVDAQGEVHKIPARR